MIEKLHKYIQSTIKVIHTIVGAPNYQEYLTHFHRHHPDQQPLDENEFFCKSTDEKYAGTDIRKCC